MSSSTVKLSESGQLLRGEVLGLVNQISQKFRNNDMDDCNLINEIEVLTGKLLALRTNPHLINVYSKILDR
ncbi:MAG: hypothetical protein ACYT04_50760 [Nostoc sp.]